MKPYVLDDRTVCFLDEDPSTRYDWGLYSCGTRGKVVLCWLRHREAQMDRETKNEAELRALLDQTVEADGACLDGYQWVRIVPAEPGANDGANWTVLHSGEAGGLSEALDRAQAVLKAKYDLVV